MLPSNEEIDAAIKNEAEAMRSFANCLAFETAATNHVKAARANLMLARSHKSALMRDLVTYSN